jgi:hypothetical protein
MKMRMRIVLTGTVFLACAVACWAQTDTTKAEKKGKASSSDGVAQAVEKQERELWEAYKNKQTDPFKTGLADDGTFVNDMGIESKSDVLADMSKGDCDVKDYKLSDIKTAVLDKDAAVIAYKVDLDGTCGGKPLPSAVYASSTFVKRGGKWLAASHQETPAATK